jgi:hypothetical protein
LDGFSSWVKEQLQHQKLLIDIPCSPISPKNNVEQGLTNDDFRTKKNTLKLMTLP